MSTQETKKTGDRYEKIHIGICFPADMQAGSNNFIIGEEGILPKCCGGVMVMSCPIHSRRPNCNECAFKKGNCGNHGKI